jgi:hypothetical protein
MIASRNGIVALPTLPLKQLNGAMLVVDLQPIQIQFGVRTMLALVLGLKTSTGSRSAFLLAWNQFATSSVPKSS